MHTSNKENLEGTLLVLIGKFIKKYKLSTPSSVQAALKGLLEKNLVSQEQNHYEIADKLLGVWLQKNY